MHASHSTALSLLLVVAVIWTGGCSREAKRDRHLRRAETYFASAEYEKAIIEYRNALRMDPTNRTVLLRVARILFDQGSPLRGMQALQAAQSEPEDPILRCRLAEFHILSGDHESGRKELLEVLSASPTNHEALRVLAGPGTSPQELTDTEAYLQQRDQEYPDSAPILLARAAILGREDRLDVAEPLVRRALELEPDLAQAHLQMGQLHLQRTNRAAAEESFAAAVRLAPVRSSIRVAYAQSKLANHEVEEARTLLEGILGKAPDYLPASLALARLELSQTNYDAALALTSRVISRDPLNFDARLLRTQLHQARGEPDKAASEWEQLDQQLRPVPFVKLQVARAHLANKDETKAALALDQIIDLSSNRLDTVTIEAHLLRARLDESRGDPVRAIDLLNGLLSRTNILEARILLLDAQRRAGRLDDAVRTCQALVRDKPRDPGSALLLGMLLRDQHRLVEARNEILRSLELAPGNLTGLSQLVQTDLLATNAPAGLEVIRAELARTNSAPLRLLEGRLLAAQRQWPEAETALRQALDLDAGFSSVYRLLANLHLAQTNIAGAAQELETMVSRRTNDVRSIMILGVLYERMDQPGQARWKYEQALRISPEFVPALNNLAYLLTERLPDLDRALDLAQQARRLAPEDAPTADTLGWILDRRGDHANALPLLREAAEKLPDNAEVQYHLGMASYMLGQAEAARVALDRAVAAPGTFPGKAEAERQLALLNNQSTGGTAEDPAVLEQRIKDRPNDLTARFGLAAVCELAADFKRAANEYEEILRRNPRSMEAALRLAQLNAGPLQNPAKALELARQARALAPGEPRVAALLGRLAFQSSDHLQAYGLLRSAAQQLPADAQVQYDFAWSAYSLGRVGDAQQAMQRALEAKPTSEIADAARSFIELTGVANKSEGSAHVDTEIRKALEKAPNNAPALMAQAALLRTQGDEQAAVPLYARVLDAFPNFAPATRAMGLILAADPAQAQKAYDLLRKTREASPDDADVARALALLSYQREDYRYAISLLNGLVRERPTDAEALFYLGMSQVRTTQTSEGQERLHQAIDGGLTEPLLSEARRILAETAEKPQEG